MGLIIFSPVYYGHSPKTGYSHVFLTVGKDKLGKPYGLSLALPYPLVIGEIIDIRNQNGGMLAPSLRQFFKKFENRPTDFWVEFGSLGSEDFLYLKNDLWEEFRDAGIVSLEYTVVARITEIKQGEKVTKVYPVRDIQ